MYFRFVSKKNNYKRIKSTEISTIIGISLLLFLLGIFGYMLISANSAANRVKEQLIVDIFFREEAREVDILKMEKELAAKPYVLSAQYVSRDSAKAIIMKQQGADAFDILDGVNPIRPSIAVNLIADYVNPDRAEQFKNSVLLGNEHLVEEVFYNDAQFLELNNAFESIKFVVLIIALVLLFVSMALINNTIRLAIYSKRFLIKTMQLVGAKPAFIRRPFLFNAFGQGFISGIIAIALMVGFGYLFAELNPAHLERMSATPEQLQKEIQIFAYLFGAIVLLGILISWLSTYFALSRYIWMKTEKLY